MKKLKYIVMAFACVLMASCMGDGYADSDGTEYYKGAAIGNNELEATNVITIAQLKEKYATNINNSSYTQITDEIKILGIVTGNDEGGNLYNEVSLQDETGAILVCINKAGLSGELPVGQQVLIDCKDLYIGGYGKQAELGGVYTNTKGTTSIGKMDRYTWTKHFKVIGKSDASRAEALAETFDESKIKDADYLASCCGKLMTIEGVSFADGGKKVYAASDDKDNANCVNRSLSGISSNNLVVRTSAYAKFANNTLPDTPQNITGIFTRYNNVWQILIRKASDVTSAKGTAQLPYTVSEALAIINAGTYKSSQVYTKGVIVNVSSVDTGSYGNATYTISEDGKDNNTITVYRGFYLNGDKFTEETKGKLVAGKKVVICGALTLYGTTPEINSGNFLYSIE